MNTAEQKEGMDRVLKHLLVPLEKVLRLERHRKVTEWQHVAGLAEIQRRLRHLSVDELVALRETVIEANRGRNPVWPSPSTIVTWGLALRLPDDGVTERVRRMLAWAADKGVLPDADLPWLLLWLKAHRGIPTRYDLGQIAEQADLDRRMLFRIEAELARGAALGTQDGALRDRVGWARAAVDQILSTRVAA